MAARSGGNLTGSNRNLALAVVLPDFLSDLKQGPPPLLASVSPPVLRQGGRGTYWGQPVVKASVTLAFGPRPIAAQLPGRSHCPGSCPLHTCTGGRTGTTSVEGAESMPVSRLRAEKGLPQARKEKQPGHSHTGSWKRARLAWVHFSTANMEERPPARVFAFLEDANKSTRQLATGRKSGPKSSRRNKDGMPVGRGWGMKTGATVPGPLTSHHGGGLGCCQPQVNPRNPCRDEHALGHLLTSHLRPSQQARWW